MAYTFFMACAGKRKLTFVEAVKTAKRIRRQREDRITEYRCDVCEYWHVGNRPEHDAPIGARA